jgi:very-short-patch-repair endonuclease
VSSPFGDQDGEYRGSATAAGVIAEGEAVRMEGILRRQEGVISLRQAVGAGLGARGVSNRVASGRWERVHPRVFRATDHAFTDRARLRGAALWAAPRAAVSGLAAAWWHGLVECCPAVIELTLPRDRHQAARPGLRVRRRDLAQADLVSVRGIWLTAVPLTVLECAVALGQAGPTFLDRALQRHVRLETLRAAHRRNLGQHGSKAVGLLLAAAARGGESEAERRLVALLRRAGIEGWQLGYLVDGYRLDLAFPAARVAVEVDGWAYHRDAERFRQDRRRQNELVLAGWTILRFTWDDLTHRPAAVLTEIRAALAA